MQKESLKKKATTAVIWSAAEQFLRQALLFGVSIVMARLVAPEAFGVIALLSIFTALGGVFIDGGLSTALVQQKNKTLVDESTVFWFGIAVGGAFAITLFLAAPLIASFYEIKLLEPIGRIYALQIFLGAFGAVQHTLFIKELNLKTPLKINLISSVFSATVGITLALSGHGIWALVAQATTLAVVRCVLLWVLSDWRPLFTFSFVSFRTMFSFGGYIFLSRLLEAGYSRLYTVLIGKWHGVYELSIYNRAEATSQLPTQTLSGILNRVAFPIFSQSNDDPDRLRRGFRFAIRGAMFINLPVMVGLTLLAEPLVLFLFGSAWLNAAPILSIVALGGILFPLHVLNISAMEAMGLSKKLFSIEIYKKILGILIIVVGSTRGIHGIAWAVVVYSCASFILNAYYTGRYLNYGAVAQIRDFMPSLLCSLAMAGVLQFSLSHSNFTPFFQLAVIVPIGIASFLTTAFVFRLRESKDLLDLLKGSQVRK